MKMSGLNGSGEMSLGNLKVEIAESNIATLFAQDLVNEVLQKAFNIATQVHESKLKWDSIEKNKDCRNLIGEYVNKKIDICDVNLEETQKLGGEGMDPFELDTEKAIAGDASLPCKDLPGRGDVGDQPITPRVNNEIEVSDQPAPQECNTTPVEKKSRVADLVKSSKQVLSAYIMDDKAKRIRDKLEEEQEQFLQVIELECVDPAKAQFKAHRKFDPVDVPLPHDDDETEEELIQIPTSNAMETVDLNFAGNDNTTENLDQSAKEEDSPTAQSSNEMQQSETEKAEVRETPSECCRKVADCKDEKKKKWNFGSRLMQLLRGPKQKARGTQTLSRK